MSKIKKCLIILLSMVCLTGCSDIESDTTSPTHRPEPKDEYETTCGYKYTYGCGLDVISGTTKCGMGYYYTCQ